MTVQTIRRAISPTICFTTTMFLPLGRFGEDDRIRLVLAGGLAVLHRVDEFALLVNNGDDFAVAGASIDVHVEDREKNADADGGSAEQFIMLDLGDIGDLSIGGGNEGVADRRGFSGLGRGKTRKARSERG